MRDNTLTTRTLDRLTRQGYTRDFICYVTNYSSTLLDEAFKSYITFMGPTLDNLVELADLTDSMIEDSSIYVDPAFFVQHQVIGYGPTNTYTLVGKEWAEGMITAEQVIALAYGLRGVNTFDSLGEPAWNYADHTRPLHKEAGDKVGAKQVW